MTRVAALVAALFLALPAFAADPRKDDAIDARLREEIHRLEVPGTGASIVMTSFRPAGDGPFPWVVASHGTAPDPVANTTIGRSRNLPVAREWVKRGYALLVPVRRGYGASGGSRLADGYGSCRHPDFRSAGEAAAKDLLATVDWARTQRDLDPKRWALAGQSAGGFASIYTASKQPEGLQVVLAFSSGRGGDPERRPREPCASDHLAALYRDIAPKVRVPVLFFYAENDEYIGPRVQKLWSDAFRDGGGRAEYVMVPPFPERRGHGVFPAQKGIPIWTNAVAAFYRSQRIDLPF